MIGGHKEIHIANTAEWYTQNTYHTRMSMSLAIDFMINQFYVDPHAKSFCTISCQTTNR